MSPSKQSTAASADPVGTGDTVAYVTDGTTTAGGAGRPTAPATPPAPIAPATTPAAPNGPDVRVAAAADLDVGTLYRILALRTDVFVVEQECPYPELDGRDLEPSARQLWVADGDAVLATLRLLEDPDGPARIGRVATAAAARGRGLAAVLMTRALELAAGRDVVLDAQAHLEHWYARFGFVRSGENFLEDGIWHLPMHRAGGGR